MSTIITDYTIREVGNEIEFTLRDINRLAEYRWGHPDAWPANPCFGDVPMILLEYGKDPGIELIHGRLSISFNREKPLQLPITCRQQRSRFWDRLEGRTGPTPDPEPDEQHRKEYVAALHTAVRQVNEWAW